MERAPAAGWYDDGTGEVRWWDGDGWTEHVAPASAVPASAADPAPAAPEPVPTAPLASAPLRPGGADPVTHAPARPETALPPTAFQPETAAFLPGVAPTVVPTVTPEDTARYTSSSPGSASTFGGQAGGTFAAPLPSSSLSTGGGGGPRTGVIVLAVIIVLALAGVGVWRYISGPPKAQASPDVVASAVTAPTGKLPAGFTAHDDTAGFKVMPAKGCASGTSCRTVKLASRTACSRLSALVLFATSTGNRVGSDVIAAKNVKAGKAVSLLASVRPAGGDIVRVSSVVCQSF